MAEVEQTVDSSVSPYARLSGWQVENFMSLEKASVEFDDRNIINIKGYNDSGKSAMLVALKVLLCNTNPTKQVGFIQDGKEYFRIVANFTDGVQILRDKYINGQSLYEMYKDGTLIYTSKNKGTLTKISEVPQPIQDYLGLITYDGVCLNSRSCFEPQIGVQTTGSENYKMFNTVLKSEEIARATELINTDKNKLVNDISSVSAQIDANKGLLGVGANITTDMLDYLKAHDNLLDINELKESELGAIQQTNISLSQIPDIPQLEQVSDISLLAQIQELYEQINNIKVAPELNEVAVTQIEMLGSISDMFKQLDTIQVAPELIDVNVTQLQALEGIQTLTQQFNEVDSLIQESDNRLIVLNNELQELQKSLESYGVKLVKCPDCGCVFDPETHQHEHTA